MTALASITLLWLVGIFAGTANTVQWHEVAVYISGGLRLPSTAKVAVVKGQSWESFLGNVASAHNVQLPENVHVRNSEGLIIKNIEGILESTSMGQRRWRQMATAFVEIPPNPPRSVPRIGPASSFVELFPLPLLKAMEAGLLAVHGALKQQIIQKAHGGAHDTSPLFSKGPTSRELRYFRSRAYMMVFAWLLQASPQGASGIVDVDIETAHGTILRQHGMVRPHTHQGAAHYVASGVYFVSDGNSTSSQLCIQDPRVQAQGPDAWRMGSTSHVCHAAHESMFMVFPSWTTHYVVVHRNEEPRISISFQAKVRFPIEISTTDSSLWFRLPERHVDEYLEGRLCAAKTVKMYFDTVLSGE